MAEEIEHLPTKWETDYSTTKKKKKENSRIPLKIFSYYQNWHGAMAGTFVLKYG
jgi:hypothetical protein